MLRLERQTRWRECRGKIVIRMPSAYASACGKRVTRMRMRMPSFNKALTTRSRLHLSLKASCTSSLRAQGLMH